MVRILTLTLNPALDVSARTAQVRPTSKLRCEAVERHPGGGGINVARALRRFDADVCAWYTSGGTTGQLLTELLTSEGVVCHPLPIQGHTRESFTVLDDSTAQEYRFVLPGPTLAASQCEAMLDAVIAQVTQWQTEPSSEDSPIVVASGSLPPGAADMVYADLARRLRALGVRLVLDTSGPALTHALQAGVFLAKPSLREFRDYVGQPLETWDALADAARAVVRGGAVQALAVSCGERGALLAGPQGVLYAPALPVPVTSAVGAGDSFVAGMVWTLSQNKSWSDAFSFAVACGSAALASTGTALCHVPDVQRLLPLVQTRPTVPQGGI